MKKRGTMLPPIADTTRMPTLANVCACRRVRQAVATTSASPVAAALAASVVTAQAMRWPGRSTP